MPLITSQFTRDPVGFLSAYAVGFQTPPGNPGTFDFVVEDYGVPDTAYLIRPTNMGEVGAAAYFLPYTDNQTFEGSLTIWG